MSLFDFYIMVDWSGAARRRGQRSDTIWVAHGSTTEDAPLTDSPFSRTEAIHLIRSLLLKEIAAKKRVLVGFDFAYGYPVDFAAALQAATGRSDQELPWLTVWRYFSETIKDDEATTPGKTMGQKGKSPLGILGSPDDLKFRSCLTLFREAASEESVRTLIPRSAESVLSGQSDDITLKLLR